MVRYGHDPPARAGKADEVRFGSSRPRRRWPRWLLIVVGAALIAVVAVVVIGHRTKSHPVRSPVNVSATGHRLLGVTAGWDLFGRGLSQVVRIQFARGRVTRTSLPPLASDGPVSFVAGPGRVIIRPLDFVPGYLVPDGHPARGLSAALSHGGTVLQGPLTGTVWVQAGYDASSLPLVRLDGSKTAVSMRLPAGGPWQVTADGLGYVALDGDGYLYDLRPDGLRRIPGALVAIGPSRWLTVDCRRGHHRCANIVIDPASGARRILPGPAVKLTGTPGVIAPDGSATALFRIGDGGHVTLHLLNLRSGADQRIAVPLDQGSLGRQTLAWSPDSRWLFVVAARGRLAAVNVGTRRADSLGITLPPLSQIVIRPG